MHWRYCSLALNLRCQNTIICDCRKCFNWLFSLSKTECQESIRHFEISFWLCYWQKVLVICFLLSGAAIIKLNVMKSQLCVHWHVRVLLLSWENCVKEVIKCSDLLLMPFSLTGNLYQYHEKGKPWISSRVEYYIYIHRVIANFGGSLSPGQIYMA